MSQDQSFYNLDPENVMLACEKSGFQPTGEFFQLNSYENRVFDIRLETSFNENRFLSSQELEFANSTSPKNIIAKFYRPGRWNQYTLLDEHAFLIDLKNEGIPVIAPLNFTKSGTLQNFDGLYTAFFPKCLGRMPDELLAADLKSIGRLLAKVHNVGSLKSFENRPWLDTTYYGGWETLDDLQDWISPEVKQRYNAAAEKILIHYDNIINPDSFLRIHGDCHRGNILHNGHEYFLVDFDDTVMGPAIQDFWMLFSGEANVTNPELQLIISGYEELREFPDEQINWIPLLRGYRIIGYAGWISRRWEDPSFRRIFPNFLEYRFWVEETEALEKIAWSL